ncbi:MAG: PqiC family protein [Nitrospirae bacterium YQR-1]
MNKFFAAAMLTMFLLLSCGSIPETKIYSLNITYENISQLQGTADIVLGILATAPRHLSQPYLLIRNSPYELTTEFYAKWEAPPVRMISEAFRNALYDLKFFKDVRIVTAQRVDFYCLKINLRRFERFGESNTGVLEFDYDLLTNDGKNVLHGVYSKENPLPDNSFNSLAEGLSIALKDALTQIVPQIKEKILDKQKK